MTDRDQKIRDLLGNPSDMTPGAASGRIRDVLEFLAAPEPARQEPDFLDEMIAEGEARSPGFAAKVDAAPGRALVGWCPQCGPVTAGDEDGCCAVCGADAVGAGATSALRALAAQRATQGQAAGGSASAPCAIPDCYLTLPHAHAMSTGASSGPEPALTPEQARLLRGVLREGLAALDPDGDRDDLGPINDAVAVIERIAGPATGEAPPTPPAAEDREK